MPKDKKHYYLPFEKTKGFTYSPEAISKLTEYEKYKLSYHPERPKFLDYLSIFSDVEPCCIPSKAVGACLIQTYKANLIIGKKTHPVMLIGQQTGPTSNYPDLVQKMKDPEEVKKWNHGMPTPASYERAIRAIKIANEENRLLIVFVDTPGADPTEESESGGIAWRIGETMQGLAEASVPTLAVIMNRACSGGAIALTGCDVVLAMEYSTYLVITPEACSSILFHTRSRANEAAEASRITSKEGFELGIVDEIIPESKGPAHRFPEEVVSSLKDRIEYYADKLIKTPKDQVFNNRIERWSKIGQWETTTEDVIQTIQKKTSRLPEKTSSGFIPRHKGCYSNGHLHHYDPVSLEFLKSNNYVCEICGHRYLRPSAWDYLDLILDDDSFVEHPETRYIMDKDILDFPGYKSKLEETQKTRGLATAMITGNGTIIGEPVIYCGAGFGFLGGSFCMSTGEKIWQAAELAIKNKRPMVLKAAGGGARMHEGCSSMVSIPKAHVALTRVERAGIPVITIITDPTLGGVAIGYGSRGSRLFEINAGNIGFSGRRVIEQYTGHKTSKDFQTTNWLMKHGHAKHVVSPINIQQKILKAIHRLWQRAEVSGVMTILK